MRLKGREERAKYKPAYKQIKQNDRLSAVVVIVKIFGIRRGEYVLLYATF